MSLKTFQKIGIICLEGLALILLLVVFGVGVLLWRMSGQPIDISFVKPYIQDGVKDADIGFDLSMNRVFLEWPDFKGPILLGFSDVNLGGDQGKEFLNIHSLGLGLSYGHLLIGSIRPTAIIVNKPALSVIRDYDGVRFSLQEATIIDGEEEQLEEPSESKDLTWQQTLALRLTEIADQQFSQSTFFSNLDRVEMRSASVIIDDQVTNKKRSFADIDASLLRSDQGASFRTVARLAQSEAQDAGFIAQLDYIKSQGNFKFDLEFNNVDPFLFGEVFHHAKIFKGQDMAFTGKVKATLNRILDPIDVDIAVGSDAGQLVLENEYDVPLEYKDIVANLSYSAQDARMEVKTLKATIQGVDVDVKAHAQFNDDRIEVPITLTIPEISAEKAATLIPVSGQDTDGGEWIGEKLRDGTYSNIAIHVDVAGLRREVVGEVGPVKPWEWDTEKIDASFDFKDMTIDYSDTLTEASRADGRGEFDGDSLIITGNNAFIGDVRGTSLDMRFTDFMVVGGGMAEIKMDVDGPLPSFLQYLSLDPINLSGVGVDPKTAKGRLQAKLDISFPAVKDIPKEEVKVAVSGTLSELNLPDMVQGLALTGGPVSLDVADGLLKVKGKGQIANRDVTLDWMQHLDSAGKEFAMKVNAKLMADKELRHHFGVELDDFISGSLPIDLTFIEQSNGNATIDLTGDITPMRINIDPFDYLKGSGTAGDVSMRLHLVKNTLTHIDQLKLTTANLSVTDARLDFTKFEGSTNDIDLSRITLPDAKIGKTHQSATIDIDANDVWSVKSTGPIFDAGPFLKDKTPEEKAQAAGDALNNPMFKIDLATNQMLTKKDGSIQKVKLKVDLNRRANVDRLEVDAFAGKGTIYVRYKPDASGQRNFEMQATDAGATLKAFDLFGDMIGGVITIRGEPIGGRDDDDIFGRAQIQNFSVVNAPALARLINAMSISGLEDALEDDGGIDFERLDAEFEWDFRPEGSLIKIQEGRTSGSSLGLSFEGTVNRATNMLNINGTIVPLSGINDILGSIPLVGDILTGGSGIIAATYTMTGEAANPKVSINPLSMLTPGFLRRILFEGGSDDDFDVPDYNMNDDDRTAPSAKPKQTAPAPQTKTEDLLDFGKPE